jgi:hypothetical protein
LELTPSPTVPKAWVASRPSRYLPMYSAANNFPLRDIFDRRSSSEARIAFWGQSVCWHWRSTYHSHIA